MPLLLSQPLQSYMQYELNSYADMQEHTEWDFPHVLSFDASNDAGDFQLRNAATMVGDIKLMSVASTGHRIKLVDDENVGVLMPLTGQIAVNDKKSEQSVGSTGLLIPGQGLRTTTVSKNYIGLVLLLPRVLIQKQVQQSESAHIANQFNRLGRIDACNSAGQSLRNYLNFLVGELDQNGTLSHSPAAQRSAGSLLLDHLSAVMIEQSAHHLTPEIKLAPWQLTRAEAYIEAHLTEPLTVTEIAAAISTSTRSLQHAFQKYRGVSPRAFIQERRLDLLHKTLCAATPPVTITALAFECGFAHLGRCAQHYRQRFGETPHATLSRTLRQC